MSSSVVASWRGVVTCQVVASGTLAALICIPGSLLSAAFFAPRQFASLLARLACCLLLISYCTLFFKKEHFKTSLPVVITTLLGEPVKF